MTEDEAKMKWCPFARVVTADEDGGVFPPANRAAIRREGEVSWNENPEHARCIGSACMAWRWDETWTSQTEEGHGGDLVVRLKRKPGEPRLGYCGLAGVPQ